MLKVGQQIFAAGLITILHTSTAFAQRPNPICQPASSIKGDMSNGAYDIPPQLLASLKIAPPATGQTVRAIAIKYNFAGPPGVLAYIKTFFYSFTTGVQERLLIFDGVLTPTVDVRRGILLDAVGEPIQYGPNQLLNPKTGILTVVPLQAVAGGLWTSSNDIHGPQPFNDHTVHMTYNFTANPPSSADLILDLCGDGISFSLFDRKVR